MQVNVFATVNIRSTADATRGFGRSGRRLLGQLMGVSRTQGPIGSARSVARHPGGCTRFHVVGKKDRGPRPRINQYVERALGLPPHGNVHRRPGHCSGALDSEVTGRGGHITTARRHRRAEDDVGQRRRRRITRGQGVCDDLSGHCRIGRDRVDEPQTRGRNTFCAVQNPPITESQPNRCFIDASIQVGVGLDHFIGRIVHRRVAGDIKVALKDHLIGGGGAHGGAQVPQRGRPDLAVRVDRTHHVGRMGLSSVDSAKTRGRSGTVGRGIPLADASRIRRLIGDVPSASIKAGR